MRSVLLIAAAIVLVGGALLVMNARDREIPPEERATEETRSEDTPNEAAHDMEAEMENDAVMEESDPGTDAGMEFPEMDMTIPEDAKVFDISGVSFAFSVKEIRVQEGDTVTINFTSNDGFHDWVVDEFDAKTSRVQTGGTSSVTFVADQKGTFEYYCSVGQHRANGMVGTLIVE